MSNEISAARTPGAKRAGPGEYCFDLAKIGKVHGGPDYTTATGPCVEGDRMIVALMRMPAGTGADAHSHPNEQWIYVVDGTFTVTIDDQEIEAKPGMVLYIPSNTVHSVKATCETDGLFLTVKDASHGLQGSKAD
jgi:quercetin dioxygenase-like cupin family protein